MRSRFSPSGRLIPLALAAASFAVAFAQRPGKAVLDTRIELSTDPALFLHRVSAVWSSTGDLGHVQSGQFVGYLFPMAPWFAFADWIGLPVWVAQRIWLGALLALAAWGVVRLLDDLYSRRRGLAHLAAGVLYAANPYVAVWMARGSVALLAYAAVPWLLVAAHRGMVEPRRWRWPALIGLLLAASGAGVNAAVVVWILPAPVALALYEAMVLRRGGSALWSFGWRAALCAVLGSAWWAIPLFVQSRYGTDFLSFTELPSSVWATPTMAESFRLLGYWLLYLGLGGTTVVGLASVYLFSAPVIVATFAVPTFAVAALRFTRRWPYAPFFCLLAVGALVAMATGFPGGTPIRSALTSAYYHLEPLRFLRTSYKAAPLLAASLACLAGPGLQEVAARIRTAGLGRAGRRLAAGALAAAATAALVLYALPIFEGRAIDRAQAYGTVPGSWRAAVADAQRTTPADHRIALLPGALFASYRWGSTMTSVGTALSKRPLLVRELVPYSPARSADLQATADDLVQQDRLVPGQLEPLLRLMGVGTVLVDADGLPVQSGSLGPAGVVRALRAQSALRAPTARYGPERTYPPGPGRSGAPVRLPDLRAYRLPPRAPGIVRLHPLGDATVLDGNAGGIADLAAVGGLDLDRALFYAGDLDRAALAQQVRLKARLVFTDSNRRQVLEPDLLRANQSPVLGPADALPRDFPTQVLFPSLGSPAQTVSRSSGLAYLRSPLDRGLPIFPEQGAAAALDGRIDTAWTGSAVLSPARRYIELGFTRPRPLPSVTVYPQGGGELALSVDHGPERRVPVHRGWNVVAVGARAAHSLRLRLPSPGGTAGIAEVRLPGLRVAQSLRLPTDLASAARGLDLSHSSLSVLLSRSTTDFPNRPQPDRRDAEAGMDRIVTLPVPRRFGLSGWASVSPTAPDPALDRLAGLAHGWAFASSGRFEGVPGRRASAAFDGRRSTAWVGPWGSGRPAWLAVRAPHPTTIRRFALTPGPAGYAVPTRVAVAVPGGASEVAPVSSGGTGTLRRPLRASAFRITVLAARKTGAAGTPPAVAIGEVGIPGLRPPSARPTGPIATACGAITVRAGAATATARVIGTRAALDAGDPLRLAGCGRRAKLALGPGAARVVAPPGAVMRPDQLELAAPAPAPLPPPASPGSVTSPGTGDGGARQNVRLRMTRPGWLVYGESYSGGWRAWCRGASGDERSLGAPVPIDGFANGWRVGAGCQEARFAFAPQRLADAGYIISGGACIAMLVLLVYPWRRRRAVAARLDVALFDPLRRLRWPWAVAVGAAGGLAGWFFYGARAGVAVGAAIAVLLVVGVSVRRLVALATVALAALPVLYLVDPAPRPSGLAFTYASHFIAGHWIGVAAMLSLAGAGVLGAWAVASAVRRHEPAPAGEAPLPEFDRPATSAPRSADAVRGPPRR
ncbi:MAG TPA: alpha-(1-_3)-arabinofuranosyltransferase family protein [Solirubrobacteraceae bacterium]|jgi:hypothetical protein|nr:alpha-(1->3)-arabinofuranosyltransferase family protein [Solirubrobacteraceae bacterium]